MAQLDGGLFEVSGLAIKLGNALTS